MESGEISEQEQKKLDKICEKNIKEKVYVTPGHTTVYNRFMEDRSLLDWNAREDQPLLTELLKKKISKFSDDDVEVEKYMELKKKKLMKKYGHTWVCPLSGEILGRDLDNITYSPYHDQYVIKHCFEEFMGDMVSDPDVDDEGQSLYHRE